VLDQFVLDENVLDEDSETYWQSASKKNRQGA